MRVLLDTRVILWWYFDSGRLKKEHLRIIADGSNEVYVSAAAIWEIEVKRRNGKIDCPVDMMERLRKEDEQILIDMQKGYGGKLSFRSEPLRHPETYAILDPEGHVLYSYGDGKK